ncbi:MAG: hypothetical protein KatS3mg078_0959 [Deltaproteobacteria bacterium]|nr:MAG: hypothetical protein KatS3mg078_0959 [Deltaproteobacteria bacterium]
MYFVPSVGIDWVGMLKRLLVNILILFMLFLFLIEPFPLYTYAQEGSFEHVLNGRELFIKNRCVNCHTIGRGIFVGPDLKGVGSRYSREEIIKWVENPQEIYSSRGKIPINEGFPPMPNMAVPPEEAVLIADYILSFKPPVSGAESGEIRGKVVNKTTGSALGNAKVVLTYYMGDRPVNKEEATTDANGNFLFKGLPWNRAYSLSINYKGMVYVTDKMVFYPEENSKELDLPVYETTSNDREISINSAHMILEVSNEVVSVAELLSFHNGSNYFYIGNRELEDGRREVLRFSLPGNASEVRLLHGLEPEDVVRTEWGFIDTQGLEPGIRRVVYVYSVPFKGRSAFIERVIDYPALSFLVLIPELGRERVEVEGLSEAGTVEVGDKRFLKWVGSNLKSGTRIKIKIERPYFYVDAGSLKWIAALVFCVMLVIGMGYSLYRKRGEDAAGKVSSENTEKERHRLILEIAELDNKFESGDIEEEEYNRLRSEKKKRLVELTKLTRK